MGGIGNIDTEALIAFKPMGEKETVLLEIRFHIDDNCLSSCHDREDNEEERGFQGLVCFVIGRWLQPVFDP